MFSTARELLLADQPAPHAELAGRICRESREKHAQQQHTHTHTHMEEQVDLPPSLLNKENSCFAEILML